MTKIIIELPDDVPIQISGHPIVRRIENGQTLRCKVSGACEIYMLVHDGSGCYCISCNWVEL